MISDPYSILTGRLSNVIPPDRLIRDELGRFACGTDASFYRLIPRLVLFVESETELTKVLHETADLCLPVTFRAAGTSLSGQALSDSVLIVITRGWTGMTVNSDASRITLQPGVIGSRANSFLARYGRKIGPDPASIDSAMIGGIAANNASGMCCGTADNSYHTVRAMRIIFRDGTALDTGNPGSRARFLTAQQEMIGKIAGLHRRIHADPALVGRIRHKYRLKNTTGFSLNAFIDFSDPIDIIEHLIIGSEGTLGFIADITYETLPEYAYAATSLMLFPDMSAACAAAAILQPVPVDAVELMDRASLRSILHLPGIPGILSSLDDRAAALLVETKAQEMDELRDRIDRCTDAVKSIPMIEPAAFTSDRTECAQLWNIRKGLFPSVGAMRAAGTTCIIEDVAVPLPNLAESTHDLRLLFVKHGYPDAIIFGHAREGNIHFVFSQNFNRTEEVERYRRLIDDVTHLITKKYDGSLKAEHGTGRNMAPFVELEWGRDAYEMMKEIKSIFDPDGLLNPGVIINPDPDAHLKALKPLPAAHPLIDKCIECGFCEHRCVSRELTLTPRQRIAVVREIHRLGEAGGNGNRRRELEHAFEYSGKETCAADGLCALSCPVGIDTGKLIKELRSASNSPLAKFVSFRIAHHMESFLTLTRVGLNALDVVHGILGSSLMLKVSSRLRSASGGRLPQWNSSMPKGGPRRIEVKEEVEVERAPIVVYFPSCINRAMGVSRGDGAEDSVTQKMISLISKAGMQVRIPAGIGNLCCGMAFDSKGYREEGAMKARELEEALVAASNGGEYPIVCEMSPCLAHMKETLTPCLRLYEPVDFILTFLADRLEFTRVAETVALHVPCSGIKLGLSEKFRELAEHCAERVVIPHDIECCGWAGDRGFTHPELNGSALKHLKEAIPDGCSHGYSTSRTCEVGLSLHSGIQYSSIIYLVDRCTSPRQDV